MSSSDFWPDQLAWLEVKTDTIEDPFVLRTLALHPMLGAQTADYARMHLSMSPFRLFSVGVIVSGMNFCAAIFDRDGVVFSPTLHIVNHNEVFVRLVYSLAVVLDEIQLGLDPTVTPVPAGSFFPDHYPSFIISPLLPSPSYWITQGKPKWTSVSLLGKGTSVWEVAELKAKDSCETVCNLLAQSSETIDPLRFTAESKRYILKNAWRTRERDSESFIYEQIKAHGDHPGLAKWIAGYDVPGTSITSLRDNERLAKDSQTLHRLVIEPVGKALWEYGDELELLRGFKMALEAHKWLCDHNIVHRDISSGNVPLPRKPEDGVRGFLADVEYARLPGESRRGVLTPTVKVNAAQTAYNISSSRHVLPLVQDLHRTGRKHPDLQQRIVPSGTLQFMAAEILSSKAPIVQTGEHDVESFINVLSYSVLRRILASDHLSEYASEFFGKRFRDVFGHSTIWEIRESREAGGVLRWAQKASEDMFETTTGTSILSEPLRGLLVQLYKMLFDADWYLDTRRIARENSTSLSSRPGLTFDDASPTAGYITHGSVLSAVDQSIQAIITLNGAPDI